MTEKGKRKGLHVRLPEWLYREVKIAAVRAGEPLGVFVERVLLERLKADGVPEAQGR